MPTTTLATLNLNWNQLKTVSAPAKSANPVLRLEFTSGAIYWLKVAPGGARVAFAEKTMNRAGFKSVGSHLLQPSELGSLASSGRATGAEVASKLAEMQRRLATGQDLILSSHVGGDGTYESKVLGDFFSRPGSDDEKDALFRTLGHQHAQLMQSDKAKRDLARMVAVDLLLGNVDRISKKGGEYGEAHFHMGNFIYDAASTGFLPIDNDMVSPSLHHMPQIRYKDETGKRQARNPTKADLYRTAILGGSLLANDDLWATEDQADMASMLGSNAEQVIFDIISGKWGKLKLLDDADEKVLRTVAASLVSMVREEVRSLVKEVKTGANDDDGLLKTLKACENVEGMNYSVFKVRSRFAHLMTLADQPPSSKDTVEHALSYGMYRDWKEDFLKLVARPVPDYPVPYVQVTKFGKSDKAMRVANTVLGKVHILSLDKNEQQAKAIAKTLKKAVRDKKRRLDYEALKTEYEKSLKGVTDSDNRIIKAKLLVIGVLVNAELAQLRTMLEEMTTAHPHQQVVAKLYAKAFAKQDAKMDAVLSAYETIVASLKRQLVGPDKLLGNDDLALIGVGGTHTSLETLCRDCRTKYGMLKAMATG